MRHPAKGNHVAQKRRHIPEQDARLGVILMLSKQSIKGFGVFWRNMRAVSHDFHLHHFWFVGDMATCPLDARHVCMAGTRDSNPKMPCFHFPAITTLLAGRSARGFGFRDEYLHVVEGHGAGRFATIAASPLAGLSIRPGTTDAPRAPLETKERPKGIYSVLAVILVRPSAIEGTIGQARVERIEPPMKVALRVRAFHFDRAPGAQIIHVRFLHRGGALFLCVGSIGSLLA